MNRYDAQRQLDDASTDPTGVGTMSAQELIGLIEVPIMKLGPSDITKMDTGERKGGNA